MKAASLQQTPSFLSNYGLLAQHIQELWVRLAEEVQSHTACVESTLAVLFDMC